MKQIMKIQMKKNEITRIKEFSPYISVGWLAFMAYQPLKVM